MKDVVRSTAIQLVGRLVSLSSMAVAMVMLGRLMGPSGLGVFIAGTAAMTILATIAEGGLTAEAVRLHKSELQDASGVFGALLVARLLAALASCLGLPVLLIFILPSGPGIPLFIAFLTVNCLLYILGKTYMYYGQVTPHMGRWVVADLAGRLCGATGLICLGVFGVGEIQWAGLSLAFGSVSTFALAAYAFGRVGLGRPRLAGSWGPAMRLIRSSSTLGWAAIVNTLYFRVDAVILSLLASSQAVGLYGFAYRPIEVLFLVSSFYQVAVLPAAAADAASFSDVARKTFRVIGSVGVPSILVIILLAKPILFFMGGPDYVPAAATLQLMLPSCLFSWVNAVYGVAFMASRKEAKALPVSVLLLLINVGGNFLLIPGLGIRGAALMTLVCEAAGVAALAAVGRRLSVAMPPLGLLGLPLVLLTAGVLVPYTFGAPPRLLVALGLLGLLLSAVWHARSPSSGNCFRTSRARTVDVSCE